MEKPKPRSFALNRGDLGLAKSPEGELELSFPVKSTENGTEGTFTLRLSADMRMICKWDGVGLTDFQAWSTQ